MANIETTIEDSPPALQPTPTATIDNSINTVYTANLWSTAQTGPNPYGGETRISVTYGGMSGIMPAPVAGPSTLGSGGSGGIQNNMRTPCVLIQVHAPISTKIVSFVCDREGDLPIVPAPNALDSNNVLLSASVGVPAQVPHPNGKTFRWRITGQYVFAMLTPFAIGDDLPSAVLPAIGASASSFTIPGSQFNSSLLG